MRLRSRGAHCDPELARRKEARRTRRRRKNNCDKIQQSSPGRWAKNIEFNIVIYIIKLDIYIYIYIYILIIDSIFIYNLYLIIIDNITILFSIKIMYIVDFGWKRILD